MMATILQILIWVLPSGGIGAAISWICNRDARTARTARETENIFKQLYEQEGQTLLQMQKRNEELSSKLDELMREIPDLRRAVNRLQRAVQSAKRCKHYDDCPIKNEMTDSVECDKKVSNN